MDPFSSSAPAGGDPFSDAFGGGASQKKSKDVFAAFDEKSSNAKVLNSKHLSHLHKCSNLDHLRNFQYLLISVLYSIYVILSVIMLVVMCYLLNLFPYSLL